jgi:hypothetical protein
MTYTIVKSEKSYNLLATDQGLRKAWVVPIQTQVSRTKDSNGVSPGLSLKVQ